MLTRGDRFVTLLGSCIAVILTDPRRTVGAMCHIVHSTHSESRDPGDSAWGDVAPDLLYGLLRERGLSPQRCEAYVYGGVRVLHQDLGGAAYRRLSWTVGEAPPQVTAVPV